MAFYSLTRPGGLRFLLGPRLSKNLTGFQGAHEANVKF